jgi:hypothetical protein
MQKKDKCILRGLDVFDDYIIQSFSPPDIDYYTSAPISLAN